MLKSAGSDLSLRWLGPALGLVLAITALRVVALAFDRTDLFVDEAQYWLWGQVPALGYYSKPPMIGWVIGAVTALAGSDAPFWVRLPAPLFHGATALLLAATAALLYGGRAAVWVAAGYVTLPMVAVGSLLISTDTIMFPFLALALWAWVRAGDEPSWPLAVLCGVALGLAALSKYAALYYLPCAVLAAMLLPGARRPWGFALVALAAALATLSPNLVWNALNGFATLNHTIDNADWMRDPATRAGLRFGELGSFAASQFAVFGPVPFALLLWLALRRGQSPATRMLLWFSLPILLLVCGQALLSRAYANWAAAAYLAGAVAVFAAMARGPGWLRAASFVLNGAVCVALPLATTQADRLRWDGRLVLARYTGQAEMSGRIIAAAQAAGTNRVVSDNRDILADLFYTGRDAGLDIYAVPAPGRALNHYALRYPLPAGLDGAVLYAGPGPLPEGCALGPAVALEAAQGRWAGKGLFAQPLRAHCWGGAE
ncbi:glycosyltransferase family 39 protein [Fertoebacter nigrum]|uniref:Glycosyltransferase family 39 protein n=1 Tax=Fertoeibacter niger TaxID=2656921 RepID=A0A8X8KMU1_9RHOB|nr:glycosyltransferase family 39 protein [Fertoeibacter niger]NUB43071.1 glycosyltransferase family 39 protein [Fertoeibacter niger]